MAFVADVSITLAWFFRDEQSVTANLVRERLVAEGICMPSHWTLEVVNALFAAFRRQRIDESELRHLRADYCSLTDQVDEQTGDLAWSRTAELALPQR